MSYLVLARKYRPQTFEAVIQQEHVTQTLSNAIASDRVAHAILFTGPRGTGKTTLARILAKAMNCAGGPTAVPCNHCRSCTEITAGSGADVFEIDGASNNGVDQIRELRENIKYMPAHSSFKIYIIDEVHMLSTPAFNALLKTLEEPPSHIMFLLATTEPRKIPVTILSRCQRHDLKRIDSGAISAYMATLCDSEGIDIEQRSLDLIAGQTGGSLRDALSLLDQVTSGITGSIDHAQVLDILGIIDRKSVSDIAAAVLDGELPKILDIIEAVHAYGHSIPDFYASITRFFRDLVIVKMVPEPDRLVDLPEAEIRTLQSRVKDVSPVFLNQILEMLFKAEKSIRWSENPKMALEIALIKLLQVTPVLPIEELIERLDDLQAGIDSSPLKPLTETQRSYGALAADEIGNGRPPGPEVDVRVPPQINPREDRRPAAVPASVDNMDREELWQKLMETISENHPSIAPNLLHSRIINLVNEDLEIEVNGSSFNFNRVKRKDSLKILEDACSNFFGRNINLTLRAGDNKGNQEKKKKPTEIEQLKQNALEHPLVADAIEIFDGKLVDVKILAPGDT